VLLFNVVVVVSHKQVTNCSSPCTEWANLTIATTSEILLWISSQFQIERFLAVVMQAMFKLNQTEANATTFSPHVENIPNRSVAGAFESAEFVAISVPIPCSSLANDTHDTLRTLLCNFNIYANQGDCHTIDITEKHLLSVCRTNLFI
jgi:hypothetical protein